MLAETAVVTTNTVFSLQECFDNLLLSVTFPNSFYPCRYGARNVVHEPVPLYPLLLYLRGR